LLSFVSSSSVRLAALKNVQVLLTRHFMPDVIDKWKATIVDVIEKSLKRPSTEESTVAAIICAILGLQLGMLTFVFLINI
jgi:hypothetical protein